MAGNPVDPLALTNLQFFSTSKCEPPITFISDIEVHKQNTKKGQNARKGSLNAEHTLDDGKSIPDYLRNLSELGGAIW